MSCTRDMPDCALPFSSLKTELYHSQVITFPVFVLFLFTNFMLPISPFNKLPITELTLAASFSKMKFNSYTDLPITSLSLHPKIASACGDHEVIIWLQSHSI